MSSPVAVEVQHRPSSSHLLSLPDDGNGEKCEWGDCQLKFRSLPELVNHLSEDHIKWKRPTYTCEWRGCNRRGIAQQSRFALISHLRSHTGEKPYDCTHPECDKSFTRTDALVKHLRQQHGEPQGGGGGGGGGGGTGGHGTVTSSSSPSIMSLVGNASAHHNHYAGGNHHHGSANNGNGHHEHHRHHHHASTPQADEDSFRRVRRAHSSSFHRQSSTFDRERVSSQHLKRRRSTSIGSHNGHSATSQTKRAKTLPTSSSHATKPSPLSHHHRGRPSSLDRQSYHRATSLQHRRDRRNSPSVSDTETDSDQGGSHGHHRRNASPGSSPRDFHAKYKNAKARYLYISRENEMLAEEYEDLRRKLRRLRIEKNVLLEAMYEMSGGPENDDLDSSNLDSDLGELGNELDDDDMDHDALSPAPPPPPPPPPLPVVKGKRGGRRPGAGRKAGRKKELELMQQMALQQQQQQQQPQQQQVLQQQQQLQPQLQPHLQLQQNPQQPQLLPMPQNIELSSEPAMSGEIVKVEEEIEADVEEMGSS